LVVALGFGNADPAGAKKYPSVEFRQEKSLAECLKNSKDL